MDFAGPSWPVVRQPLRNQTLPSGTDSVNVPETDRTAVDFQTSDNVDIANQDLTDTFVNAPVKTVAVETDVALQLIDQSPVQFDEIVFADLIAAHAQRLDLATLTADGSGNSIVGVHNVPNIQSLAVADTTLTGLYSALADAIQRVHTKRFQPPTAIAMHPRRWGWLLSAAATNDRCSRLRATRSTPPVSLSASTAKPSSAKYRACPSASTPTSRSPPVAATRTP